MIEINILNKNLANMANILLQVLKNKVFVCQYYIERTLILDQVKVLLELNYK